MIWVRSSPAVSRLRFSLLAGGGVVCSSGNTSRLDVSQHASCRGREQTEL